MSGRSASTATEARRLVEQEAQAGYDFIKLHPGLTRDQFDAAAAVAAEIGIDIAGHVSVDVGVERALEAGQATIDHLDGYIELLARDEAPAGASGGFFGLDLVAYVDPGRISEVAADTAAAGVWIVPTQSLIEHWALAEPSIEALAARPEMAYVAPGTVAQWARSKRELVSAPGYSAAAAEKLVAIRRELIREMQRQGVGLLLGSDAPQVFNVPGFSLHPELAMMVAAGLSPYEALATATSKPAEFFGRQDDFGQVRVGLAADLILADGNPLVDVAAIAKPAGVMLRGHWLDRAEIDARLAEIARRQAR